MGLVADREPVTTYDRAVWRVVYLMTLTGEEPSEDTSPSAMMFLVADIFWVRPERVRADVCRYWRRCG